MPQIEIRYFGISAFEITTEKGVKVVIDPNISAHPGGQKFSPVGPEALTRVDAILVSHGDHCGDTLELVKKHGCTVFCAADVATHLRRSGVDPKKVQGTVWGMVHDFKGIRIRTLESHHISWMEHEGLPLAAIPLGFILYTESGMGIYHPGDTSISNDLKLFGELYRPQVGLMPVGLPGAGSGKHELSAEEAAMVTSWMGLKMVIPMHYAIGSTDPMDFANHVHRLSPDTRVIIMEFGEKIVYSY